MSYLTESEQSAIPPELLPGPPVTIAKASQTHWPKADMVVGGYLYFYSRASDEFIRYDVLKWVHSRRELQTKEDWKMSERELPDPGEGWRLLKVGDVIQDGDEYDCGNGHDWEPSVDIGCKLKERDLPYRRRISVDTPQPATHHGGDPVNHPKHYTSHPSGIECIQVTEYMGFNLGNAVKYVWRADLKGDAIEDLKKARWYIDREIQKRGGAT